MDMKVDLLIHDAFVMTMEGPGVGLIENGAVAVKGDRIVLVGSSAEVSNQCVAEREIRATNQLVMPGMIDAHMHTGMTAIRGVAQDMNHWMHEGIFPYQKHMDTEQVLNGSVVNIMEGIKAGTTTFGDYDHPMQQMAPQYAKLGVRAVLTEMINEMPADVGDQSVEALYPLDPAIGEEKLQQNIELIESWHGQAEGRITCLFGPQGPDMVSKELLQHIAQLADRYETKIHMHVAQGDREIEQMERRYGKRSIPYLDEIGYLNEYLIAVHLTEATSEETALVAQRGVHMIYCAGSIGIIDGLVPPVLEFIEAGGRAALGSDQAPGNNGNNMFNEMKFTAILNKVKRKDPTIFPAWKALRMATIEGAHVLGLAHEVGSLREGKKADLIMLDLEEPHLSPVLTYPVRNIVPNLVYAARGHEVHFAMVDGKIIMEDRQLKTINEKEAIRKAQESVRTLEEKVGQDVERINSPVYRFSQEGYY